ncbi:glyoxalase [Mesorhizobium sp. B2-5-13]|uniref:VOC family protein n=1 Tax=unclassified Mesorhizobium TaxID=325217 RepID=UPI001127B98D|nr:MULTISPECIES: VOC family protein [unclassified Mesorhizobium]TPJ39340.1 glyoxalase [Mesorhizobium sp. B2-6-5]TPJ80463.1 glyoxalase [Mesorhizobium sp. B2-5-13]TPK45258.1 glyoxalase [Mesorhizobium sp. B2-5-5]
MPATGAVRQVALSAGRDLDATLAFWRDVLGMSVHARYDPPGIAFIMAGDVRLLFTDGIPAGTIYLDSVDLEAFHAEARAAGIPFTAPPMLVHRDTEGQFGPAGESEWMAFIKDPAGNTIGLVERLPSQEQ